MNPEVILGVPFFKGTLDQAVAASTAGGLIVAPSGPGLAWDLRANPAYRTAVAGADLALTDSGLMVLEWNILCRFSQHFDERRLHRISGLKYLEALLLREEVRQPGQSFWLMPSEVEMQRNLNWLKKNGFDHLTDDDCRVAPHYPRRADGVIKDDALAILLEQRRPSWVFLNVGSGVQEPLGHWLRDRLSYRPALVCTGAAIAFLSGGQAKIPAWADRMYVGWLMRIISNPGVFGPRYFRALKLVPQLLCCRHQLPPLRVRK